MDSAREAPDVCRRREGGAATLVDRLALRRRPMRALPTVALLAITLVGTLRGADTLECDRAMRKTMEAIQAWRRLHDGHYPDRLADLVFGGFMPDGGGVCPSVRRELEGASPYHDLISSRKEGADPFPFYEYELSAIEPPTPDWWFPPGKSKYTRQQLKSELLRRAGAEQVPILRCSAHREAVSLPTNGIPHVFRNATCEGVVYWSGDYWEENWLDSVPYTARDAMVLFGLQGPPFGSGRAPELAGAVDLRPWVCAFGDLNWWWNYPLFDEEPNSQRCPDLRAFFEGRHGRVARVGGTDWWVDGLTQLQGRVESDPYRAYVVATQRSFVEARRGAVIGRPIRGAQWLQATVWKGEPGEPAGWLVWHFGDGTSDRVPIVYGRDTARFWSGIQEASLEEGFPSPAWQCLERKDEVGRDRWVRLYGQSWTNPHPERVVATLDFVSNTNSAAGPFLISVNTLP